MFTVANFGAYVEPAHTPEWIRSERYEYCDSFVESVDNLRGNKITEFLRNLFK